MDDTVDLVAKHCGKQLSKSSKGRLDVLKLIECFFTADTYQRCILANQKDQSVCDPYRRELAACASDAIPLVAAVKRKCQRQIQDYDFCLKQGESDNDDQIVSRCVGALRNLHQCTEAVRRDERISNQQESAIGVKSLK